jgi:hypothetical protein
MQTEFLSISSPPVAAEARTYILGVGLKIEVIALGKE